MVPFHFVRLILLVEYTKMALLPSNFERQSFSFPLGACVTPHASHITPNQISLLNDSSTCRSSRAQTYSAADLIGFPQWTVREG